MSEILVLSPRLDHAAARSLYAEVSNRPGKALQIDGQAVTFCGGLSAQILLAAARNRRAAGIDFSLTPSAAMRDDLDRLGVLNEILQPEPKP